MKEVPASLETIRGLSLEERERRALAGRWNVPGLFEAEQVLRRVMAREGVFRASAAFVAPGSHARAPAVRGATVLATLLSPRMWVVGLPVEDLERVLGEEGPPGPVLKELARAEIWILAGVDAAGVERIRDRARRRFGKDVLRPGRAGVAGLRVLLRFDVARGAAAGEADFLRYRPLLP